MLQEVFGNEEDASLEDHSPRHDVSWFSRHIVSFSFCQYTVQDILLWFHPCGPTVDRLRRSTVGSGTREDVATAYELPVLHEVVYIAPVPAVFAAPAFAVRSACNSGLRHRSALAIIAASAPVMEYVGSCSDPRTCARGRVQRTSLQLL